MIGLPFVLFFPGYTLVATLSPKKDSLRGYERIALSFGLSIAVVPLICLAMSYLWEISLYPVLISTGTFILTMCVTAYLRRRRLPPDQRFQFRPDLSVLRRIRQSGFDSALAAAVVIAAIAATGTLVYSMIAPRAGERFTEFYVLGLGGTADYYPHGLTLGASADVTIGIVNHEGEDTNYAVRISTDTAQMQAVDGVTLHDGETWQRTITLTPTQAGDGQEVKIVLYRTGQPDPYRELRLWMDVRST